MKTSGLRIPGLLAVVALVAVACSDAPEISAPAATAAVDLEAAAEVGSCRTGESIVDIAVGNPAFEVLTAAVVDEGLVDALDGPQVLTVFAPTDAAFVSSLAALGTGVTDEASAIAYVEANDVSGILLYHVTRGARGAESVVNVPRIRMLSGGFVTVDGTVLNDGQANLIPSLVDIPACNGVIHAIDGVLLP